VIVSAGIFMMRAAQDVTEPHLNAKQKSAIACSFL
jgi:hypothetical protein